MLLLMGPSITAAPVSCGLFTHYLTSPNLFLWSVVFRPNFTFIPVEFSFVSTGLGH